MNDMRKVMIATPAYDGKVDALFADSLVNTIKLGLIHGINFCPIYIANDALIQRARNDLAKIGASGEFECMVWIDSDLAWEPQWVMDLVNYKEDVVGGTYRKKTDTEELYVVVTESTQVEENGLIDVLGLGTGFVKVSQKAAKDVFDASMPYKNTGGRDSHMVFDIGIVDGELHSEDTMYFHKLRNLGYEVWLDPKMTLDHVGTKKFVGNFENYLKSIQPPENVHQVKFG
jgi:hypothetical protein